MFTEQDHIYMARAIRLAEQGLLTTDPNPRVGCVLVKAGELMAEGWHVRAGEAHAEIAALENASGDVQGATAYVTLEPCSHHGKTPPCVDALIAAGMARVVIAMQDPNPDVNGQGIQHLRAAGIQVDVGLLETQAEALNPGFIKRMRQQRPYVRLKLAMSLDGRTALASGVSHWITSEHARVDVQRLRARSSAIMTGINTVIMDNPSLNVRLEALTGLDEFDPAAVSEFKQPLRIVLDSRFKMSGAARLLKLPGDILVITTTENKTKASALSGGNIQVVQLPPDAKGRPNLTDVMSILASAEINELMVESGHTLAGALLEKQLVDELLIYMAPCFLGDAAKGLVALPPISNMKARMNLAIEEIRPIGNDFRITAKPVWGAA